MKNEFARIAAAALARFEGVVDWLGLAGGKNQGREYLPLNPKRGDTKPGSFTINRDSGAWADFAVDRKGGDLISLAAYLLDCRQIEAAQRLAAFLGLPAPERKGGPPSGERERGKGVASPVPAKAAGAPDSPPGEVCVMPVPGDAPSPPLAHPRHGRPAHRYEYCSVDGELNFCHDRYEPPGERKQFSPLTLWRRADGSLVWRFKAPPAPRPLYGLPLLAVAAGKPGPAILVEGEKAAEAAAHLLPRHPVLCWQGGAQAVDKADFLPLAGWQVWLWADADESGARCMARAADRLREIGAAVKRVNLDIFAASPGEEGGGAMLLPGAALAEGDDAADLPARGWTAEHMRLALARPDALQDCEADPEPAKVSPADTAAQGAGAPRRFELDLERGVFYHEPEKAPRWVCAPLEVTMLARNSHGDGWGKLVEFFDPDRTPKRRVIPDALLSGDGIELERTLRDAGLHISPSGRPLLRQYLIEAKPGKRARTTNRTGWHEAGANDGNPGAVYVLPDGDVGAGAGEWLFESESPAANPFRIRGTLQGWQQEVGELCKGNSRLIFAVSLAFAAPLLYLAGMEGGGFHFRGDSSGGKTTAMHVAASVCGGHDYMQRWRATDNGIEALAPLFCDAQLLLDELAQIEPKAAGEAAYLIANGGGKARAGRSGGARGRTSWRVLFLSAGEVGLVEHMGETGRAPRAGQELRLAEIPADAGAGLGIFEDLHGCSNGAEFANTLNAATRRNHGAAFICYLRELVARQDEVADTVRRAQREFERHCLSEDAHGQARRVAARFALVGAGGELATAWGVTGWQRGEAMQAARTCFQAWLSRRGGEGNQEERAMLAQVREFLRRYGESAFTDWERPAFDSDKHAPVRSDRAGYRRQIAEADAVEFFVFNEVWRARVCKGYDPAAVGRLLLARGYIKRGKEADRPWLVKEKLPTEGRARVVHILPAFWDGDDD